jgi:hypothetical protein
MRILRFCLGVAITVAVATLMGPVLRLTSDLALRLMLVPVFLALSGVGGALI